MYPMDFREIIMTKMRKNVAACEKKTHFSMYA